MLRKNPPHAIVNMLRRESLDRIYEKLKNEKVLYKCRKDNEEKRALEVKNGTKMYRLLEDSEGRLWTNPLTGSLAYVLK